MRMTPRGLGTQGSSQDCAAALKAGGRPELARIIVGIEGRDAFGQRNPGQLGANIDVHIRRHRRGIVERADANEAQLGTGAAVNAPDRYLAGGTAIDHVRAATVGWHRDRFDIAGQQGYSVGLDKRVEHEGASRLPLAIATMTAMHEHRRRGELIPHRSTSASAFQIIGHMLHLVRMAAGWRLMGAYGSSGW